jgi:hypothetical protein
MCCAGSDWMHGSDRFLTGTEVLKVQSAIKGRAAWTVAPGRPVATLQPRHIPEGNLPIQDRNFLSMTMQLIPTREIPSMQYTILTAVSFLSLLPSMMMTGQGLQHAKWNITTNKLDKLLHT